MEDNQIKLLALLAKKIKAQKKDKTKAETTLKSAKILTSNGNFSSHYQHLKKVVAVVE